MSPMKEHTTSGVLLRKQNKRMKADTFSDFSHFVWDMVPYVPGRCDAKGYCAGFSVVELGKERQCVVLSELDYENEKVELTVLRPDGLWATLHISAPDLAKREDEEDVIDRLVRVLRRFVSDETGTDYGAVDIVKAGWMSVAAKMNDFFEDRETVRDRVTSFFYAKEAKSYVFFSYEPKGSVFLAVLMNEDREVMSLVVDVEEELSRRSPTMLALKILRELNIL